jgi:hypothetical protein
MEAGMRPELKAVQAFDDTHPRESTLDDEEMVNDSLGTVVPADSTGVDDDKETGDARRDNFPTRED